MTYDEYFDEVRQALEELYDNPGALIMDKWSFDRSAFVDDHMQLVKASYSAGYLDALDDVKRKADNLGAYFDE